MQLDAKLILGDKREQARITNSTVYRMNKKREKENTILRTLEETSIREYATSINRVLPEDKIEFWTYIHKVRLSRGDEFTEEEKIISQEWLNNNTNNNIE